MEQAMGTQNMSGFLVGNLNNAVTVDGLSFPKTYTPTDLLSSSTADDLVALVSTHRNGLLDALRLHGALLFRGFHVHSPDDFARVVAAFRWEERPYEGFASRVKRAPRVYTANEAPLHHFIPFHHEMSLMKEPCTKVFFHCMEASPEGGQTSIVRSDLVVRKMDQLIPDATAKLRAVGIKSVHRTRNVEKSAADAVEFGDKRKLWHRILQTDDEDEARKRATERTLCTSVRFNEDGTADFTYGPMNPIVEYNGKEVMFNTLLGSNYCEIDVTVYSGDGEPLPEEVSGTYSRLIEENAVDVGWKVGDVLLVDNLMVQHARRPGKPPRSILVSVCK